MGQVKRGRDRREEAGEKGEDRRKTNLSVENENRKGSQREVLKTKIARVAKE